MYDKSMDTRIQKLYFVSVGGLVVLISFLNALAFQFYWYWKFWWFDMVMHTLGGLFVGSFGLWYYFFRKTIRTNDSSLPTKTAALLVSFIAVAVIGIGWELFELSVDKFIAFSRHDPVDTASDLFFDTLGSVIALPFFFLMYRKNSLKK